MRLHYLLVVVCLLGCRTFVSVSPDADASPRDTGTDDGGDVDGGDVDGGECDRGATECAGSGAVLTCESGVFVRTACDALVDEEPGASAVCRGGECGIRCDEGRSDCNGDLGSGGDGCEQRGACPFSGLDLLFMIDNSNSMTEEQANLAQEFGYLITALASGDLDGDGREDFSPIESIQVGVISSDMGTGGFPVETCSESNFGDDGVLRDRGNTARRGCMGTYPKFLSFSAGVTNVDRYAEDVTCVAAMGVNGCGFEQPLDAILKAVTRSSSRTRFHAGTVGHRDGANDGFVRRDSLLAIVALTDEDDCSASDPDLYNRGSVTYAGDLNLRCFAFPEAVHPIDRYVDGLIEARAASNLVFAGIVGVPRDVAGLGYGRMLAHPDMQERIDPRMPTRLVPSCNRPGTGLAFPPVRVVRVAQGLEDRGALTTIQSICQDDLRPAVDSILRLIADRAG